MTKISFIIPMYKAEKYIARIVTSLQEQTDGDFEAIFVDDGSPDKSAEICGELFDSDARFKLLKKENGGVSDARNAGLDVAAGEYVFFADADDYIEKESVHILSRAAHDADADIVFFGRFNDFYKDGVLKKTAVSLPKATGVFKDEPCQRLFDKIATSYFVTDKLFRREIIEKNNIRFKKLNIGEDGVFFAEYIRKDIKSAAFLDRALYHYTVDESASLSASYHEEREKDNFYLSGKMRETVEEWKLLHSPMHKKALDYCTVRDLQLGIKNINLSKKSFADKCSWLKEVTKDKTVREAVFKTSLKRAKSRNDKIKLFLLKMHMYKTVIYISGLNQKL